MRKVSSAFLNVPRPPIAIQALAGDLTCSSQNVESPEEVHAHNPRPCSIPQRAAVIFSLSRAQFSPLAFSSARTMRCQAEG